MKIKYEDLWAAVIQEFGQQDCYTVHGPNHWKRVERNACILATKTGAKIPVVRLFALFHDSKRENDNHDPEHGLRGAEFAAKMRNRWFDISNEDFDLLHYACVRHTDGYHHDDPTIGTCWDADRLDLSRVDIIPDSSFMSTAFGAEIASYGDIQPWLHLTQPHHKFSLPILHYPNSTLTK